ncbi:MAG: methyltransferase domain-containing protein [Deltaproteobacteria bacterium]|nr:methyltransferase domain-containing protein [Deltaproteobacteria bacterium]
MHKYSPEKIGRLLRPARVREIRPLAVLKDAGLKKGDSIADVGSGPGFFSFPASRIVGKEGAVYAIDTQKEMIEGLKKQSPPPNVVPVLSGENSIPLDGSTVDFALVAYVLHETESKAKFLKEIRRIMKPGARLLVIDWKKKKEGHGPPREERLSIKTVEGFLRKAGFVSVKASPLNDSHYRVQALKPSR